MLGLFLLCRPEPLPSSPFDAGGDPLVAIAFRLFNSTADGRLTLAQLNDGAASPPSALLCSLPLAQQLHEPSLPPPSRLPPASLPPPSHLLPTSLPPPSRLPLTSLPPPCRLPRPGAKAIWDVAAPALGEILGLGEIKKGSIEETALRSLREKAVAKVFYEMDDDSDGAVTEAQPRTCLGPHGASPPRPESQALLRPSSTASSRACATGATPS